MDLGATRGLNPRSSILSIGKYPDALSDRQKNTPENQGY
jgi:hypothetical protein